ncbi:MAG: ABC transporter permease subunit [Nitrospinae bacterium]|nr:ABC transporter permease subunit [Nitrospinota bacterium]
MRNVLFIVNKELRSSFNSPVALVTITIFTALIGYYFYNIFASFSTLSFQAQTNPVEAKQYGALNVTEFVIRPFFGIMSLVLLIMLPMLTMRSFAEEKKSGTMELLLTFPVRDIEAIMGKFFGCLALFFLMLALTFPCMALVAYFGEPEWGVIGAGYVGMVLLASAFIAMGLFMSSITENQIVAAILSFAALLVLYMIGYTAAYAGEWLNVILSYLSFTAHFESFAKGVIDTSDVNYYLLFVIFFLFLSMRSLESKRWRG